MAGAAGSVTPVETSGNCCLKSANNSSSGFRALVLQVSNYISISKLSSQKLGAYGVEAAQFSLSGNIHLEPMCKVARAISS